MTDAIRNYNTIVIDILFECTNSISLRYTYLND